MVDKTAKMDKGSFKKFKNVFWESTRVKKIEHFLSRNFLMDPKVFDP